MKINQIIREKRLEKGLTQEQVAHYLGVSAPAVNKWEKGISYPDIVLLPPLARLLDTDLNTLLSFQDNLSDKEVALFLNEVSETIERSGFEAGYALAMEKLKEYPTCDLLVGSLAMVLDGALNMNLGGTEQPEKYQAERYQMEIENLYRRSAQSELLAVREQARSCLISKLMDRKDYVAAQELLDSIPKPSPVDRDRIQANILMAQGELEKAAQLMEGKLVSVTNDVHATLFNLLDIAIMEGRMEDAQYIADVDKHVADLLNLIDYNSYIAHFRLAVAQKNREECLKVLLPMLESLTGKLDVDKLPLYRHIQTKEVDSAFRQKMKKAIVQSIITDEETAFLKDSPELMELMKTIENQS